MFPWPVSTLPIEVLILTCTVILLGRYWLNKQWRLLKQYSIPHDPPSLLKLGHTRDLAREKIFKFEEKQKAKHGLIWGYYLLHAPRIVVHDPEILRQIFVSEFSTFPSRTGDKISVKFNGKHIRNSVLSSAGEQWKRGRVTLMPTFSMSKLKLMMPLVTGCVENTIKVFEKRVKSDNGQILSKDIFMRLSLDVICSTAFSVDVNSQDDETLEPELSKYARQFSMDSFFTLSNIIAVTFPMFREFFTKLHERKKHIAFLNDLCKRLVEIREEHLSEENQRVDLMQLMIDAKIPDSAAVKPGVHKGLTSSEIIGNALAMLFAGYETTGVSMNYLAYNLAMHPNVQRKLQAEIDDMYDEKGLNVDYDSIRDLKYLDMCFNESLRLYNPVSRTLRMAEKDITISGLTIPKNWHIVFPIHQLCHANEYWDEPMAFRPERMEDMSSIEPMMFQPFGTGPRNCIGSKFAYMVVKVAFCMILRQFWIEPDSDTPKPPLKLMYNVTTHPIVNFHLRVVPRSRSTTK